MARPRQEGGSVRSCAETASERKRARSLYLQLRALGLDVRAEKYPEDPTGYRAMVEGLYSLSETSKERLVRRAETNKHGLLKVWLNRRNADLAAIWREGAAP